MKFASVAAAVLAFALPAVAQTESVTYDTTYDNPSLSLTSLACSNNLIAKGYTTLSSLPNFPNAGGVYTVTSWDSPACGTCYEISYGDLTIPVLAVDVALDGFNLAEETMDTLTGGLAVELGRVEVTAVAVDASYCGI